MVQLGSLLFLVFSHWLPIEQCNLTRHFIMLRLIQCAITCWFRIWASHHSILLLYLIFKLATSNYLLKWRVISLYVISHPLAGFPPSWIKELRNFTSGQSFGHVAVEVCIVNLTYQKCVWHFWNSLSLQPIESPWVEPWIDPNPYGLPQKLSVSCIDRETYESVEHPNPLDPARPPLLSSQSCHHSKARQASHPPSHRMPVEICVFAISLLYH